MMRSYEGIYTSAYLNSRVQMDGAQRKEWKGERKTKQKRWVGKRVGWGGGGGMKESDVKIQGKEIEKLECVLENAW